LVGKFSLVLIGFAVCQLHQVLATTIGLGALEFIG